MTMKAIHVFAKLVLATGTLGILFCQPVSAQDRIEHLLETLDAKVHAPEGAAAGKKTARLTGRVTLKNAEPGSEKLPGVKFSLGGHTGKIIPEARVVASPPRAEPPKAGQTVVEFDAAVYDFVPEAGERSFLRGHFPSGRSFGRVVRFKESDEPLPEEAWEKEAAAEKPEPKKKKRKR